MLIVHSVEHIPYENVETGEEYKKKNLLCLGSFS